MANKLINTDKSATLASDKKNLGALSSSISSAKSGMLSNEKNKDIRGGNSVRSNSNHKKAL